MDTNSINKPKASKNKYQDILTKLTEFDKGISRLDSKFVIKKAYDYILSITNVSKISIMRIEEGKGESYTWVYRADQVKVERHDVIPVGWSILSEVYYNRKSVYRPDIYNWAHTYETDKFLKEIGVKSDYILPLLIEDRCIGTLNCACFEKDGLNEDDRQLMDMIAPRLAQALENAKLYEELHENQSRLQAFIDSSIDAILIFDENFTLIELNDAASILFNLDQDKEQNFGKRIDIVFPQLIESPEFNKIEDVMNTGESLHLDSFEFENKDGIKNLQIRFFKVGTGLGMICTDFTLYRQMQDELQKMEKLESVGVLAGGIAHDFNNILAAILGNISLARIQTDSEEKAYKHLLHAEKAVEHAMTLTNQLLTFAKGGDPVKEIASIDTLIMETVEFMLSGTANIQCDLDFDDDLYNAEVDKGQMGQVFSNLIRNSVDALPDGGKISVKVSNVHSDDIDGLSLKEGYYLKIVFKDNGAGIEKKNLSKIFDPYFTTKSHGNGLGLASVHSVVNKHEGSVSVKSTPDEETIFTIYLPALNENNIEKHIHIKESSDGNGRILVMDDDIEVLDSASEMFELLGYNVTGVTDGEDAVQEFSNALESGNPYSLTVLDLTNPTGIGGEEVARMIREVAPDVFIIAMSGYSNNPVLANYKDYGFNAVLLKPYTVDEVKNLLKHSTSTDKEKT